jgi:hypothetical protein
MWGITPDRVFDAVRELLGGEPARSAAIGATA